jgi:hypothetical protein
VLILWTLLRLQSCLKSLHHDSKSVKEGESYFDPLSLVDINLFLIIIEYVRVCRYTRLQRCGNRKSDNADICFLSYLGDNEPRKVRRSERPKANGDEQRTPLFDKINIDDGAAAPTSKDQ